MICFGSARERTRSRRSGLTFRVAGLALLLGALLVAASGADAVPDVVRAKSFLWVGAGGGPLMHIQDPYGIKDDDGKSMGLYGLHDRADAARGPGPCCSG